MFEVYESRAEEYDELVAHEDRQGNLGAAIGGLVPPGSAVLELGAGTGRVTRLYAPVADRITCCDRSDHMMGRARLNLARFGGRIDYRLVDNDAFARGAGEGLPAGIDGPYDVILEGWALGHSAVAHSGELEAWLAALQAGLEALLAPGGKIVIVETLGTNVEKACAPGPVLARFYELLEKSYGYENKVIDTSYGFEDLESARRIMGLFFGEALANSIPGPEVREYSGVWTWRRPA